jgi:ketosteroid isomerase-like protein
MATVTTEHPNATVFRRAYEAFNSGDLAAVREFNDPNVVWHVEGRSRFAGDKRGIDATLAFFGELMQASGGTFRLEVHDIVANDDHAVALVTSHIEAGGKTVEGRAAHVLHMKNGKATESWFYGDNQYDFDSLFP